MNTPAKTKTARITRRITTWTLRLTVIITILFFLAVLLTAGLGGNGEIQRKSLENVIGGFFGVPAKIHQLNMYQIFPTQRIDVEKMIVASENDQEPTAILERGLYVNDPIAAWMGGYPVRAIEIDNFIIRPGFWGPQALHISNARITPPTTNDTNEIETVLVFTGSYGQIPLTINLPMVAARSGEGWAYRFDGGAPMTMTIGDYDVRFVMQVTKDKLILSALEIAHKADLLLQGTVIIPYGPDAAAQVASLEIKTPEGTGVFQGTMPEFSGRIRVVGTGEKKKLEKFIRDTAGQGQADKVVIEEMPPGQTP